MKLSKLSVVILLVVGFMTQIQAQRTYSEDQVIQFSGKVVTADDYGEIMPLPFSNIAVLGTRRGTSADSEGFFSFVALEGDTIIFSQIGYQTVSIVIPDTLEDSHYSWVQIMTQDSFLLPEAVIFPWPDREHFEIEFLAIDISDELRDRKDQNLAAQVIEDLRYTIPADGTEASRIVLREMGEKAVYNGQLKPMNIFNPLAWKRFVDAWRRGDFKSKDKQKKKK
jgi:hypothetical protein